MYDSNDFSKLVNRAFVKNGVDNPNLEKAITDILYETLNPKVLSRRIYKEITEHQEREKNRIRRARGY